MRKKFTFALLSLLLVPLGMMAQNVTIRPTNGSMICALTDGSAQTQLGFQIGAFGTWIHEQLSLTMTGSNYKDLTEDGMLASHSNHFITGDKCTFNPAIASSTAANYIVADWGGSNLNEGYITIALPKGYRFTSYRFNITHDVTQFGENNTAFTLNTSRQVSMNETGSDFGTAINTVTLPGNSSTVQEFTRTGDDMGNVLYFRTTCAQSGYYAICFRYIELTFTADADASIEVTPSEPKTNVSMVEVPFSTGKIDFGEITQGTYQGVQRVSYQFNTVSDMSANMLLYEKESVQSGTGFDGTPGDVAYSRTGSISTTGDCFKLTPSGSDEQVYFLETPVSAKLSNDIENPIQFRIVEATVHYTNQAHASTFDIAYTRNGTKYYLGTNGYFTTTRTIWTMEDNGNIHNGNNYLSGTGQGWVTVSNAAGAGRFTIDSNNNIRNSGNYLLKFYYNDPYYGSTTIRGVYTNNNTYNGTNVYATVAEGYQSGGSVDAGAKLYVYDAAGENPQVITISGEGSKTISGLNNDAIKIGVQGGSALVNFSLKVQALNPYIDQMTVVMNDTQNGKNLRMTQTFTADDFSVGGGTFRFYLPHDCVGDDIHMTFEDLYSKYGDETYDHTTERGNSDSRYNFVMSQHNQKFTNDNIYNAFDEAASATLESVRITNDQNVRTKVGTVGNIAFRFNNADELATTSGHLEEYPFTLAKYTAQTNPGSGRFIDAHFESVDGTISEPDRATFYVFTTDETRYNIAPTTATQHRFYAFYEMIVELVCQDYEPVVSFEKIYDNTLYDNGTSNTANDAFYGAIVTAPSNIPNGLASDVATYKAISEKLGTTGAPANLKQILYLDMSQLNGVYHATASTDDAEYALNNFNELKAKLATNAFVFLPANSTATFDNFAYAKKGEVAGSFQAANNFIITDKQPFYSPYDIQMDAANRVEYKRLVTTDAYDKVQNASLILPFAVTVSGGTHTNPDGTSFSLHTMQADQALRVDDDQVVAFFPPLSNVSTTAANTPYLVQLSQNSTEDNVSFVVAQTGGAIAKTTDMASDYTFAGAASSGVTAGAGGGSGTFTFTPKGTYAGQQVPKANNIFYFAKNVFVSSLDYMYDAPINIAPFRAYYTTQSIGGAKLSSFVPVFEEGEGDVITAIAPVAAVLDVDAPVYDLQGRMVAPTYRELKGKKLAAGMYVVNGVKIIVK